MAIIVFFYKDRPTVASQAVATRSSLWMISTRELILIISVGIVWGLPNAGFIVLLGFAPSFLVSNGIEMAKAGMLVSLISWISIGSMPLGGWLTDRTGRVNAFIIGGVLISALFTVLLPVGFSVLGCILLLGLAFGIWPGAIMALPSQVLSPDGRSTGFGVYYTVFYGVMTILPPVAGWLRDFTGGAKAPVLFGGMLMALTVAVLAAFRVLQRRWPVEESGQLTKAST